MFIIFPYCSFKCDKENCCDLCQNSHLAQAPLVEISYNDLLKRYKETPLVQAIVCGGLEPFDNFEDLFNIVKIARGQYNIEDDIVIYTGYTEDEIDNHIRWREIKKYHNIIIKYGRYRPNQEPHYDEVLGVNLASDNQYAKRYSK